MVAAIVVISLVVAAAAMAQPSHNLALHRPYELSPQPNYAPTRNEEDRSELTDGKRVLEAGGASLWTDIAAVGWARPREPIVITLDLGAVEPIGAVAVHTAFGSAGVSGPRSIALLTSDDGKQYRLVGDLIRLNGKPLPPDYGTYTRYSYQVDSLQAHGRFIRFVVVPSGRFFFSDEIEVFSGDHTLGSAEYGPEITTPQLIEPQRLTQLGAYARIRTDLEAVQALIGAVKLDGALTAAITRELADVGAELSARDVVVEYDHRFRAIVPLNDLHQRIFASYGRVLAAEGAAPMTIWHSPPYQMIESFARPDVPVQRLALNLMINERRAEVFNLTNASAKAAPVTFAIEGLPGGTNPPDVRVFEVQEVDTREGKVCASALLPLKAVGGQYQTMVAAGVTRQIWLAFEPRTIPPGRHTGTVRIRADVIRHDIQIDLNVAPIRFPDRTRLAFSLYDEIVGKGYSITERNQQAARQFVLDDPLINGVWCNRRHVPLPRPEAFDAAGALVGAIDFSQWDAYVAFWSNTPQYFLSLPHDMHSTDFMFAGLKVGTPEADRALSQWAAAWAEHNHKLGLKPGQVVVSFVDEPHSDDQLAASYHFARAFSQGTRDILTYTNPHIDSIRREWGRKNLEVFDIVCPHLPAFIMSDDKTRTAYVPAAGTDRELWFYSCSGPARMLDPSYYRLQPWHAYRHGGAGSLFWAFGDAGGSTSWNEYAVVNFRETFTPIYIGDEDIHTSKHFEAAREGVMDYEYLRMLEDRIARLNDSPAHQVTVKRAKSLLQSLPASLIHHTESRFGKLPYLNWSNASALAEDARKQVLAMLVELGP